MVPIDEPGLARVGHGFAKPVICQGGQGGEGFGLVGEAWKLFGAIKMWSDRCGRKFMYRTPLSPSITIRRSSARQLTDCVSRGLRSLSVTSPTMISLWCALHAAGDVALAAE
jgi:hypothetical protein